VSIYIVKGSLTNPTKMARPTSHVLSRPSLLTECITLFVFNQLLYPLPVTLLLIANFHQLTSVFFCSK